MRPIKNLDKKVDQNVEYYRLFWDYYGPSGSATAQHFHHHLLDFLQRENFPSTPLESFTSTSGVEDYTPTHSAAWCILPEIDARKVAEALKAKRGDRVEPEQT